MNYSTQCWCGQRSYIETFLSGTGFSDDYKNSTGIEKCAEQIIHHAKSGDILAQHALTRYEEKLAKTLAHIINIIDPHTIVLGGGMSNIQQLYTNVPTLWQQYVFSDTVLTISCAISRRL